MKKALFAVLILFVLFISACAQTQPLTENKVQEKTEVKTEAVPAKVSINFDGVLPTHIKLGDSLVLTWKVNSDITFNTEHTAVHYGYDRVADEGLTDKSYTYLSSPYSNTIPRTFESTIKPLKAGPLRLRAHVNVNGVDYWTEEKTVNVD